MSKINSTDAKYIDMLHIVNNYQTRFNQFMDYFIKLFNTILSTVTTLDLEKEDALFQSVSEMSRSALDFPAANIVSKLSETIPKLIKELDIILRAKFAEEGPTIEEIDGGPDGGKRKTRRRKTLTLRKRKTLTLRKRKANKTQKKRRNTRIVHQKLDKLAKFFTFLQ